MYVTSRTNWIVKKWKRNTPEQKEACRFVWLPGRRGSIPVCGPQSVLQADPPHWFEAWWGDHQKKGGAAACPRRGPERPLGRGPWIPAAIWGTWAGGRCRGGPWWGQWWGRVECSSQGPGGAEGGGQMLCFELVHCLDLYWLHQSGDLPSSLLLPCWEQEGRSSRSEVLQQYNATTLISLYGVCFEIMHFKS